MTVAGVLEAAGLNATQARVLVNHEVVTDGQLLLRQGDKVCLRNPQATLVQFTRQKALKQY